MFVGDSVSGGGGADARKRVRLPRKRSKARGKDKQGAKLAARQKGYDKLKETVKTSMRRPGSLNRHKQR